jgi:hypothetical protein
MRTRSRFVPTFLSLFTLAGLFSAGCGESAPPAPSPEQFEEAKKDREVIIQKEYGGGGPAPKAAAPAPAPAPAPK